MTRQQPTWEATRLLAYELFTDSTLSLVDQVARIIESGATPVNCAKAIREVHGLGLAECKDLVDSSLSEETRHANERLREALATEAMTREE